MKRVLFICAHNSARSQMAEGLVNHDLVDRFKAFSSESDPAGAHPPATEVMSEIELDTSNGRSKDMDEFAQEGFDFVITLCDQANENCPAFFIH